MSRAVVLRAPAKINLSLHVGARREDGFHDVRTLLQSIALADTLTVTPRRGPLVIAARAPGVPTDRTNLIWRAAERLWRALGREGDPRDAHVKLEKVIPVAAGLGGGSADAAAALVGLSTVWSAALTRSQLFAIAAEVGSDVPFFLHGGTVLAAGRGEELYPTDDARRMALVIVKPSFGIATADAYAWLDEDRRQGHADSPGQPLDLGWHSGPVNCVNDLQGPVARRQPGIAHIIDACLREGARLALMTGSGSAVVGVFTEAAARRAATRLRRPDWLVLLTRSLDRAEAGRRLRL